MLEAYKTREYGKIVFTNQFQKLAKIIATASPECNSNDEPDIVKAALLLIYDVLISKEVSRKKNAYI